MTPERGTAPAREHRGGKAQRFLESVVYRLPIILQCAGAALGMLALMAAAVLFGLLLTGIAGGGP